MCPLTMLYPAHKPTDWSYWLIMRVPVALRLVTECPVNCWLIARGKKERM